MLECEDFSLHISSIWFETCFSAWSVRRFDLESLHVTLRVRSSAAASLILLPLWDGFRAREPFDNARTSGAIGDSMFDEVVDVVFSTLVDSSGWCLIFLSKIFSFRFCMQLSSFCVSNPMYSNIFVSNRQDSGRLYLGRKLAPGNLHVSTV